MLFLIGPRQVGKATIAKLVAQEFKESLYVNWDIVNDRRQILFGQDFIEKRLPSSMLRNAKPIVIFDEIHKYKDWKNYLKGFFDLYKDVYHILITGSARLDILKTSGDSMMGRYFQYMIHPFSVKEIANAKETDQLISPPKIIALGDFNKLYKYGGFPDPYLKNKDSFSRQWHSIRNTQLFRTDIADVTSIKEVAQLEVLVQTFLSQLV